MERSQFPFISRSYSLSSIPNHSPARSESPNPVDERVSEAARSNSPLIPLQSEVNLEGVSVFVGEEIPSLAFPEINPGTQLKESDVLESMGEVIRSIRYLIPLTDDPELLEDHAVILHLAQRIQNSVLNTQNITTPTPADSHFHSNDCPSTNENDPHVRRPYFQPER